MMVNIGKINQVSRNLLPYFVAVGFGVVAALFYFTGYNMAEVFMVEALQVSLFPIVIGLAFYGLAYAFTKNRDRSAIIAALSSLYFFYFETIGDLLRKFMPIFEKRFLLIFLMAASVILAGFLLGKLRNSQLHEACAALGIIILVLLAFNLASVSKFIARNWNFSVSVKNSDLKAAKAQYDSGKPDVYYIMPDDYVGSIALKESYGFDNSAFENQLKGLGFFVATSSFSNYPITTTSLPSSFSAGLLEAKGDIAHHFAREPYYRLIQNPQVPKFFKQQGYEYAHFGSWWNPTQADPNADKNFRYSYEFKLLGKKIFFPAFVGSFLSGKTAMKPILERLHWQGVDARDIFIRQISDVIHYSSSPGKPRFTFVHLLVPHLPAVFAPDGSQQKEGLSKEEAYIQQVQFANKKLVELVKGIRSSERGKKAIIVLATDEGYPGDQNADSPDTELRVKTNILTTFYFPDGDYSALYNTITPVNFFRIVINKYFGAGLPLMPDQVFVPRQLPTHKMDLTDVTERVLKKP